MSIICSNWLIGHKRVSVLDYCIMPKNSICCSVADVKHTCEIAGKESRQCRISESAWSNDSEIRLTIILQEVRKELRHVSLLRII